MHKRVLLLVVLLLGACAAADPPGDAARGAKLFSGATPIAGGLSDCLACHPVSPGQTSNIGTNLSNIGLRAGRAVAGQPAEQYLRTAIVDPDAHLAGGFQEGIMERKYGQALSPQDISDLVAYMLTLRSGQD